MRRNLVIQIVVLLAAVLVSTLIILRSEQNRLQIEHARVAALAGDHAHALQANIERSLSATYALAALVRQGKGDIPDFETTAAEMLPFYPGASSLQLAPGGIVRQIVPLAGNEGAIGHNLLKDPARTKEAFLARDTGKLTLAGPFNLVQGGVGAVGRLPVFLDKVKGTRSFWGFTVVLIRFPEVLDPAKLSQLEKRGIKYELWRIHPDIGKRQVISASSTSPLAEPINRPINLPNGTWTLSVAPIHGWSDPWGLALKGAIGALFSLLLVLLLRSLLNTRAVAQQIAERLTGEQSEREREFRTLAENSPDSIIRYDSDCRRIYVNPAFERTTGIPMDEALGRPSPKNWHGGMSLNDYQKHLRLVMETDKPIEIILDWPDQDGNPGYHSLRAVPEHGRDGIVTGVLVIGRDITDIKRAEEERLSHLRFLESMDKVNRAILGANDLEQMMSDLLDVVLSIFACDRAYLMHPCDPEAESWVIPMERTTPEYPGAKAQGVDLSKDARVAGKLRLLLSSDGPVNMGYGTPHMLSGTTADNFNIRSMMAMAVYPKVDKPWEFGIHQCSNNRAWTSADERLLKEIGRRLEDALTGLLTLRDLQASEERYRRIVDTATEGIWVVGPDTTTLFVNARMAEMLGCSGEEMIGRPFTDFMFEEDLPDQIQKMVNRRKGISQTYERRFRRKDGLTVWTHLSATPIFDAMHLFNGSFAMFTDITERKHAENVLRESEERFRTITEKSPAGVYIIQDDLFRYVNPAFAEIHGYAPEEIIDRLGPVDFLTPEDREHILENIRRRTAGEIEFSHHEFHISRKDGSIRVVEAFGSRALHQGRPAVLGTIIDITERKRSEEQLFQVTERWERTFDAVPDLIAIIDTDFRIVQVNKAMADRLGAKPAECAGQVCYAVIHNSDSPPYFCPHAQTLTDCREHMCEVREECLGGDFIVTTSPIYDSAGQLMGSVHVARDITEHKHAETKLNEQLHFLQQLLDSIPIPVYYKDVDGLYLGCNSAFETFIGLSRSDIVGKTVYEVAPKERADKHHEADSALLRNPGVQIYEASGIYNDGECHNVIFNKATFVDADNCVAGTVGAMIDITSLKKAEEERKMLEAQLHQSQKMEAIGQLAGGIAHDFNNILTAIMGYSSIILLRMEKESPLRKYVEQVLTAAERAAELTNGLLVFSRRQILHAEPMDLCGVVQDLEKMLARLVPEDIDFRTTVAEGNLIVMADKVQIEQVLMNLVTNAKDAMPMGGALTIEVSPAVMEERFIHAHGFGEPGDYACVTVSDTGQGMDEETRERIFEPFFTTKEVGKGTGLGMAIIYGIIQQHNGYISVYSEKEMGTTFRIYLPLITEGISEVQETKAAEPPPGGTETVLLAEDDAAVLELHRMMLEEAGYRVIEAVDGQDALDKFTEHMAEVDILATDVIMPKMNGKILYEAIRKIRPDIKVLFISGYTKEIIVERGILEDEFSVITKPVTSHELLKKMRKILDWNRL